MKLGPVEVTTRFAQGGLPDLTAAWAFVMEHVDLVGGDPMIEITPVWSVSVHDMDDLEGTEYPRTYSAVVSGMVTKDAI